MVQTKQSPKNDLIGKVCAGHTIIAQKRCKNSPDATIVLGVMVTPSNTFEDVQYVTWTTFDHQYGSFCWGHYSSDFEEASKDFTTRANK